MSNPNHNPQLLSHVYSQHSQQHLVVATVPRCICTETWGERGAGVTSAAPPVCAYICLLAVVLGRRNVTLTAKPGLMPVLDFRFLRSVVHLCRTCVFTVHGIAIANERRGNGASVDFFVGVPGSVLMLRDSYRMRLACTTTGAHVCGLGLDWEEGGDFLREVTAAAMNERVGVRHAETPLPLLWLLSGSHPVSLGYTATAAAGRNDSLSLRGRLRRQ